MLAKPSFRPTLPLASYAGLAIVQSLSAKAAVLFTPVNWGRLTTRRMPL